MSRKCLAAISLHPRGGGVATASRVMWQAIASEWADDARLITLVSDEEATSGTASTLQRLQFGARLAKAQALRECDWLFYTHIGVAQVQTFLPASALQRPYGVFLHGIEAWRELTAPQRRVLQGASLLVANSDYTAARVRRAHRWIGDIHVSGLALPVDSDAGTHEGAPVEETGEHTVLIVGRLDAGERYKGHDELITAWPSVRERVPDAALIVAGSGDDEARLRKKVMDAGLEGAVKFFGFLTPAQLLALYGRVAVFAMPSRNEGFGLVYLEAMTNGVPCIGSTEDAARELIDDGRTGFLVPQNDPTVLAERLVALLVNQQMRQAMGAAAQHAAQERFSYERFRSRFVALLSTHLRSGVAPSAVGSAAN